LSHGDLAFAKGAIGLNEFWGNSTPLACRRLNPRLLKLSSLAGKTLAAMSEVPLSSAKAPKREAQIQDLLHTLADLWQL